MRSMWRRRAPEVALAIIILTVTSLLYLSWHHNLSSYLASSERADRLLATGGPIVVGCEWYDRGNPQYFMDGVRMAVHEINDGIAREGVHGIRMPNGSIRPLQMIYARAQAYDRLLQTDPTAVGLAQQSQMAAVIDNLPDEWVGRTKAVYEAAGIASISTAASFPNVNRSLRYSMSTAVHDDLLAAETVRLAPYMLNKTLGSVPKTAGLLSSIEVQGPSWTADVCQNETQREERRLRLVSLLKSAVEQHRIDEDVALRRVREQFVVPSDFWLDVLTEEAQARFGADVTARQVLDANREVLAPAPFRVVQEYYPDQSDLLEQLSAIRAAQVDYLVLVDNTTLHVAEILRQLRQMQMSVPVFVSDNHQFDRIVREPGEQYGDVYTIVDQDPTFSSPALRAFRTQFQAFLRSQGEEVYEPAFMTLQGYEAVYLLRAAYETIGSIEPLNVVSALRHHPTRWPGRVIDGYKFSASGDVIDVGWVPVWLHQGKLQKIDVDRGAL